MGKRIVDAPLVEQVDNSQRFPVGAVGDETAHSMSVGQLKEHIIGDSDTPNSVVAMIEDANDRIDKEIEDRQQADRNIEALITDDIRHIEEAEVERKRNEIARENNEATRRQNEMQRQEDERTRQDNEQQRIDAEGTRNQRYEEAEEERFQLYNSAESSRTSIFDSNESTRQQQEHVRVSNENVRNQNEATRNTAETRRQQNENSRIASEDTRQQHEQLRMSAEVERMTNESQRVTAERERQSIFNQSQTQRDNDFNAAQTLRQTTFEQNEAERDNLVNAEIERLDQYAITRVELVCDDDQHITLIDDPTPLTYAQVKALVDDTTKFVTLRYLDMWWMLPSYDDGGAIMFTSSDIQGGHVMVARVILNDDGQMNNYSIVAEDADNKTDDMSVETAADGHRTYPTTHAVNGALATKANTDGYYTELTSGMAENLLSPDGITDEEPYIYRTSAGSTSISTGVAEIKSLYGNSIVWNQISNNTPTTGDTGLTFTRDSNNVIHINGTTTGSFFNFNGSYITMMNNLTVGKYLLTCNIINNPNNLNLLISALNSKYRISTAVLDSTKTYYYICEVTPTSITKGYSFGMDDFGGTGTLFNDVQIQISFHNLTKMFGEGNEPTIEQFKQWFPNDYYEYNEGEIINVNIDGLKTIGFNQWDGEFSDTEKFLNVVGEIISDQYSKVYSVTNFIRVFPNTKYFINRCYGGTPSLCFYDTDKQFISGIEYLSRINGFEFITPSNCHYIKASVCTEYKDLVCINLTWSGYRNGDYEPYNEHNISIPVDEIKDANGDVLFPDGLCLAGNVRDEITPTKALKRVVKKVLNGNEDWRENIDNIKYFYLKVSDLGSGINEAVVSNKYIQTTINANTTNIGINTLNSSAYNGYTIYVRPDNVENMTLGDFKRMLSNDNLVVYYGISTPIEVEFKDVPQVFGEKLNLTYFVDDFGTEEFTITEPTAPVKHSTFYMTNLRDKIRNIDGNTDAGALMNGSVDNLLTTLGTALGGTLTKTWDAANKKWTFSFTPNTTTLNEEGGEQ